MFTGVSAQTTTREKLDKEIEETSKVLPIVAAKGVMYTQEYTWGNSAYEVNVIDENYVSLALLIKRKGTLKKTLLQQYGTEPNLIFFVQKVVECNMDIVVQYVSKQSGKSFSITLSKKIVKMLKRLRYICIGVFLTASTLVFQQKQWLHS